MAGVCIQMEELKRSGIHGEASMQRLLLRRVKLEEG